MYIRRFPEKAGHNHLFFQSSEDWAQPFFSDFTRARSFIFKKSRAPPLISNGRPLIHTYQVSPLKGLTSKEIQQYTCLSGFCRSIWKQLFVHLPCDLYAVQYGSAYNNAHWEVWIEVSGNYFATICAVAKWCLRPLYWRISVIVPAHSSISAGA